MKREDIQDRIDLLWEEIQANEEENMLLANEIRRLEEMLERMENNSGT